MPVPDFSRSLSVVGVSAGPDGSGYERMYLPYKYLTANSRHLIQIPAPGVTPPAPTREDMADVDVFVCQRPIGVKGMRLWDTLDGAVARVYEIDDNLIDVVPSGLGYLCDERIRESIRYLLRRSDMVTVSTPALAEEFGKYNSNCQVLQNCVNEDMLRLERTRRDRVTVGWGGGSSHLIDMCAVQDPLRRVLDANPQADMHFIGVDYSPLLRRECRWTGWSDDVWAYYNSIDFDIGIAPLADVKFNVCKSHLKALDYAALGIPVIAADMEPYREFVVDGVTGYLCKTEEDWERRLTELIHDEAAREEMGAKAREVAAQWTIQKHWQDWERAYELAAGMVPAAAAEITR